jgi:cytochrome c oxidase subunit 2
MLAKLSDQPKFRETRAPLKSARISIARVANLVVVLFCLSSRASAGELRPVGNIFKPLSAPAESVYEISLLALLVCAAIFLVVAGLLTVAMIKFRARPGDEGKEPPQIYGSNQLELAWTVIPMLIVVVLVLVTARTIADVQNQKLPDNTLKVRVVGHQWWWEIHYPDHGVVTANELHIPVSARNQRRPTALTLESADVIHSFWVPQLAGKTDLIPNRRNSMWVEPYATGTYLGNCAEFCGVQHAKMLLRVVVESPEEFAKWIASHQAPAVENPAVRAGRDLFMNTSCVNCHRVAGTTAAGIFGPDLTRLMSRETIASGAAPNTPENLRSWMRDPQIIKPGCLMPNMQLTEGEVIRIVAYLQTLK